jgi:hypothetical protein
MFHSNVLSLIQTHRFNATNYIRACLWTQDISIQFTSPKDPKDQFWYYHPTCVSVLFCWLFSNRVICLPCVHPCFSHPAYMLSLSQLQIYHPNDIQSSIPGKDRNFSLPYHIQNSSKATTIPSNGCWVYFFRDDMAETWSWSLTFIYYWG